MQIEYVSLYLKPIQITHYFKIIYFNMTPATPATNQSNFLPIYLIYPKQEGNYKMQ